MSSALAPPDDATFHHPGLLYDNVDDYLRATTGFVRTAVAAGDGVLVAVPGKNLTLLRDGLTDCADHVVFADMAVEGLNPGRIIPAVLLNFAATHSGRRVSIIGEPIWPDRTEIEYPACVAHEALINTVFAGHDATILCPYDTTGLDQDRLLDAWRTHPTMIIAGRSRPSPWYTDPLHTANQFNQPLPAVPPHAATLPYATVRDLSRVRRFVADHAQRAGLSQSRVDDVVVAVNELAENTILHTTTAGTVTIWTEAGYLACQVDDQGHIADPLAGRIPPAANVEGGRGLLLANQLCDLVRVYTRADGTSIRLHLN